MKTLVVEDDFTSRRLLQRLLSGYGDCDIAINGKEAMDAFHLAWKEGQPYDLICLDIMMPEMDGQEVLKEIRQIEAEEDIDPGDEAKIIMTSVLFDGKTVMEAFREQAEAYLVKPIDYRKLLAEVRSLGLLEEQPDQ